MNEVNMSENNVLKFEDAYDVLVSQIHAPVFFEKLASVYNIKPQTPDEAKELLLLSAQLRNAHDQQATKTASDNTNLLTEARQDLEKVLTKQGFQSVTVSNHQVKQAAAAAVQNPLIKEAAVVFGNHMSAMINK